MSQAENTTLFEVKVLRGLALVHGWPDHLQRPDGFCLDDAESADATPFIRGQVPLIESMPLCF